MKDSFNFTVNNESNSISVARELEAALPLVWDAFSKKEVLDQWWAPKPWICETKNMEFKEHGQWLYAMVGPEGETHYSAADYLEIIPMSSITCVDYFTDAAGNPNKSMPSGHWKTTFEDKGQTTVVKYFISYSDPEQLNSILQMGFKDGVRIAFEGLDEVLQSLQQQL